MSSGLLHLIQKHMLLAEWIYMKRGASRKEPVEVESTTSQRAFHTTAAGKLHAQWRNRQNGPAYGVP